MKLKTKELVICSIFASLTAILTQISIPLPAVPLTMQVFAVALCGLVLGKRLGFISQIIYVLLGTIGLPVFAQFSGGIGIILGPTGGFILSFPIIAFIVGYFSEKFKLGDLGLHAGLFETSLALYSHPSSVKNFKNIKGLLPSKNDKSWKENEIKKIIK